MVSHYLKKAGIAARLNKDPAAVARYSLPAPDAYSEGKGKRQEPLWSHKTIANWAKKNSRLKADGLKEYESAGSAMMENLVYPFQTDKLYQLRLYASGYGFQSGCRATAGDNDFIDDNFGRILCNVYALSPTEAIFDSNHDNPARRTARVVLEYARAHNAGRRAQGKETLGYEKMFFSLPMAMSIAADNKEIDAVCAELKDFQAAGETIE